MIIVIVFYHVQFIAYRTKRTSATVCTHLFCLSEVISPAFRKKALRKLIWRALRNEIQLPKPKDEQMLIALHITLFLFKFLSLFHFSPQYQFLAFFLTALIFWFFFIKEKEQQNVGNHGIEWLRIKVTS